MEPADPPCGSTGSFSSYQSVDFSPAHHPNPLTCRMYTAIHADVLLRILLAMINQVPVMSVVPTAVAEVDAAYESDCLVDDDHFLVMGPQ